MKKILTLLAFVFVTNVMLFSQCAPFATPNPNNATFNMNYNTAAERDAALVGLESICFPASGGGTIDFLLADLTLDNPSVYRIRALSGSSGTFGGENGNFDGEVTFKYLDGTTVTCVYVGSNLDTVLPVELISFDGIQKDQLINLNWQTASEINNEGFIIEKGDKTSAEIEWNRIDFISGNGTTQTLQSYSFDDQNPVEGTNYYRLKQVGYDGGYEYSPVITVEFSREQEESAPVTIFPNPVKDQLTITNGIGQAIVYNLLGQPVKELTIQDNQATFQFAELLNGQYFLQISQADGSIVRKQFLKAN